MTDDQWDDTLELITQLWPRCDMNDEIARVWRMKIIRLDAAAVADALRHYKGSKTTFPQAAAIVAIVQRREGSGEREEPSRWGVQRRHWIRMQPQNRQHIEAMSDEEVELRVLKWEFDEWCNGVGQAVRSTAVKYWQWQEACARHGHRQPLDFGPESDEAVEAYLRGLQQEPAA